MPRAATPQPFAERRAEAPVGSVAASTGDGRRTAADAIERRGKPGPCGPAAEGMSNEALEIPGPSFENEISRAAPCDE
jgi:hypothetical protein